ncbi:sigma-54 dependent transcriptional regulator [Gemmatimonas aurantiaca]|uniref:sigma-54-dependent transcriptional regulator n=1 Tax=Gemmatimonas aurantiaca TaxID=173480 RepID=UPI00301B8248
MYVLVVDDEPALREVLSQRLTGWGYRVATAADAREAEALLEHAEPDLVLSDVVLPGLSGLDLLRRFKARNNALPVVLITAHGNVDAAVEAMKAGATDFLTKPIDPATLRAVLESVSADHREREAAHSLDTMLQEPTLGGLLGGSRGMRDVRAQLALVASSDAAVLITGESGTGKEVAARTIHELGVRASQPFVAVNAAAIPEGLMESEIFGHERGAFTGAVSTRAGCFELANLGTLLLDELAEMPIALQPKLLRILEDGRVRRLGASRETTFDVRVIAATNRDPMLAVQDGQLRSDLMYRLNVFSITLPPLRDRIEDIPLLARHFIHLFNGKHAAQVSAIRDMAMDRLQQWHWPGNVRELRNVIERSVVIARQGWIDLSHLPPYITSARSTGRTLELPAHTTLAEAERLLIRTTLERTGNNKAEAARQLGLDVKTVRNKLRSWSREE